MSRTRNPAAGNVPQPLRDSTELNFERVQEDAPIDDPGDAQRTSKSEPDGDGEEG
jgi:hypothetical protein